VAHENGSGAFDERINPDFPWEESEPKDNELPNDDGFSSDEQNQPVNGHLYSFDAPAVAILAGDYAFYIARQTFKERVRMQISDDFPEPPDHDKLYGSPCSPKYDWHCVYYLRRQAGKSVPDADNPSYSDPVRQGTGNEPSPSRCLQAQIQTVTRPVMTKPG